MDLKSIRNQAVAIKVKPAQNLVDVGQDARRESMKASIHKKQANLLSYSSMSTKMPQSIANGRVLNQEIVGKKSVAAAKKDNQEDRRALPAINVEQVSAGACDISAMRSSIKQAKTLRGQSSVTIGMARQNLRVKDVLQNGISPARIPGGRNQSHRNAFKQVSRSQRLTADVEQMSRRHSQQQNSRKQLSSFRSNSRSKLPIASTFKPKTQSTRLQHRGASLSNNFMNNPSYRILQIDDASSDSSDKIDDPASIKRTFGKQTSEYSAQKNNDKMQALREEKERQKVEDKQRVIEVRNLLTKQVFPEGDVTKKDQKKQQREVEKQFQSIYYINQLQPNQLPLPKVSATDFQNLQASLKGGKGATPRMDSVKTTIKQQAYKGNNLINSRGQNLINLISPIRGKGIKKSRPITANIASGQVPPNVHVAKLETNSLKLSKVDQISPHSKQQKSDNELIQEETLENVNNPYLDQSEEIYRNDRFQKHQDKEAKSYIKKVLLEDIVFHQTTGQYKKIFNMQRCVNDEQSKMVMQISKNANKGTKGTNSIQESSELMSKSYDHTSRPESRQGIVKTIDISQVHQSIGTQSQYEATSQNKFAQRNKSSHEGTSVYDFIQEKTQDAAASDLKSGFNSANQRQLLRGQSQKSQRRHVNRVERNSSAKLFKAPMASSLKSQDDKSRGSNPLDSSPVRALDKSQQYEINRTDGKFNEKVKPVRENSVENQQEQFRSQTLNSQPSLEQLKVSRESAETYTPRLQTKSTSGARGASSSSRGISDHHICENFEDHKDAPCQLTDNQKEVVRRLLIYPSNKCQEDVDFLYSYFNDFDFMQASKKGKDRQFNQAATQKQQQKKAQEMAKDQKSVEQMCRVTKHLFMEKGQTVFNYDSIGDLFYMVISGRVNCKIPFNKQIICLSQAEKNLFQIQFKDDLLSIQEAADINKKLLPQNTQKLDSIESSRSPQRGGLKATGDVDFSKLQHYKNPYDMDQKKLLKFSRQVLTQLHTKILNEKRKELEKQAAIKEVRQEDSENESALSDEQQNEINKTMGSSLQSSTDEKKDPKLLKQLMKDPAYLASIDPNYLELKQAFQELLEDPESQSNRRYYQINIMKVVKIYQEYGSFGELSLLTKKRRKAKLETLSDTHFAILSKDDYLQAQYKAQNQRLKEKLLFLKSFDLFKMLTDSQLSVLSYHMQEELFYRGQVVYKEGVDPVNKIYLIRHGDFLLTKQLVRKTNKFSTAQILHEGLSKMEKQQKDAIDNGNYQELDAANLFSYNKFKNLQSMKSYSLNSRQNAKNDIQICILSDKDAFGYQELLERGVEFRGCTVKCLKNQSQVVTIDKNQLITIVRNNPNVLESMKQKWTQFLVERVSNKLFVEQIRKKERLPVHFNGDQETQKVTENEQAKSKRGNLDLGNWQKRKTPTKTIEIQFDSQSQGEYGDSHNPLMSKMGNEQMSTMSEQYYSSEKKPQFPQKQIQTFRYRSKAGNRIINRPHDEQILRDYVDNQQEKFILAPAQGFDSIQSGFITSNRNKSESKRNFTSKQVSAENLDTVYDKSESKITKQKSKDPYNRQVIYLKNEQVNRVKSQQPYQLVSRGNFQQVNIPSGWAMESHMSENQRLGSRTSPMRQPVFNNRHGDSSDEKRNGNIQSKLVQDFTMLPCSENITGHNKMKVSNVLSNRGSQMQEGSMSGLVDMTFQRTSMNQQAHAMSTPATVEDLVQLDKSRPSNQMPDPIQTIDGVFFGVNHFTKDDPVILPETTIITTGLEVPLRQQQSRSQMGHLITSHLENPYPTTQSKQILPKQTLEQYGQERHDQYTHNSQRLPTMVKQSSQNLQISETERGNVPFANWTNIGSNRASNKIKEPSGVYSSGQQIRQQQILTGDQASSGTTRETIVTDEARNHQPEEASKQVATGQSIQESKSKE